MSRLLLLFLALHLAACEPEAPPPGEPIGTFRFTATLRRGSADEGRCAFDGAPARLGFDAILSHDPQSGALWLTTGEQQRPGRLEGAHFEVRVPPQGHGVPRQLDTCTVSGPSSLRCPLTFTEVISGRLLAAGACNAALGEPDNGPQGNGHGEQSEEGEEEVEQGPCPRVLKDGSLDWRHCGCIIGTLEERVLFPEDEACLCTVGSRSEPAPERCDFVYALEGRPG